MLIFTFGAQFSRFFLELESATLWARCRAIIERGIMCQCRRDLLKVSVMISEQLRNHNNYIPIEQPTFKSAAAHWPVSLGRPALRIATLGVS